MDVFNDFCLACDGESNGPYCSPRCRLMDLERANPYRNQPAPTTTSTASQYHIPGESSRPSNRSSYVLPPAFDFAQRAYDQPSPTDAKPQSSFFMHTPTQQSHQHGIEQERSLTPSSSRSSLASNRSSSNPKTISEQAKQELQEYFSLFENTRRSKRRQSTW